MHVLWKGENLGEFGGRPTLKEARKIKVMLNVTPPEFGQLLMVEDPDAVTALLSIMLDRVGKHTKFEDIDGDYEDLDFEYTEAEKKQSAEAQAKESVNPVVLGILSELGVDTDNEQVHKVVVEHLIRAQETQGKDVTPSVTSDETPPTTTD